MIVLEQLKNKIIGSSLNFQEACEIEDLAFILAEVWERKTE